MIMAAQFSWETKPYSSRKALFSFLHYHQDLKIGRLLQFVGGALTHISLASFLWDIGNRAHPDQTPQKAASDQGLHCLIAECSIKT